MENNSKSCEICGDTELVYFSNKFQKMLCNRHILQLKKHGKIIEIYSKQKDYIGVRKSKKGRGRWISRLWYNNETHNLGSFAALAEAIKTVDNKIIEIRGPNAITNAKLIEQGLLPLLTNEFDLPKQDLSDLPNEEWRDIPNFKGLYKISNMGRVKKLILRNSTKEVPSILNPSPNTKGYLQVSLYKDNIPHCKRIHRLVGETFIPNPHNLPQLHHRNDVKADNRVENLMWVTNLENMRLAFASGLFKNRKPSGRKLNERQVKEIRNLYATGQYSMKEISQLYNMGEAPIQAVIRYKTYKEII